MRRSVVAVLVLLALLSQPTIAADASFEHAQELARQIQWREFGPAFEEAAAQHKPVFAVLTAAWCHFCHVYESEAHLYDGAVSTYLNEHYIPVLVDGDRRPELRRQFLPGGWPSTAVLAPNGTRLFGFAGTRKPEALRKALERTTGWMANQTFSPPLPPPYAPADTAPHTEADFNRYVIGYYAYLLENFDEARGDFAAPNATEKFPHGLGLAALMDMPSPENTARVARTLELQLPPEGAFPAEYRLFDPLEGGFHRYSAGPAWRGPHYEKLLSTNARLLFAYSKLAARTRNATHLDAVNRTLGYLLSTLQDPRGGFYASQYGDQTYYLRDRAGRARKGAPRVDPTFLVDANAEAALALLQFWRDFGDERAKAAAVKTLDRLLPLAGEGGMPHYLDEGGAGILQGGLADNAFTLLALADGYNATQDARYLAGAKALAAHALERLYDWNSAGFFERNSGDISQYRPVDLFSFRRPYAANGVMARALLDLYAVAPDPEYAVAAVSTIATFLPAYGGVEDSFYLWTAAKHEALASAVSRTQAPDTAELVKARQAGFFLNRNAEASPSTASSSQEPADPAAPWLWLGIAAALIGTVVWAVKKRSRKKIPEAEGAEGVAEGGVKGAPLRPPQHEQGSGAHPAHTGAARRPPTPRGPRTKNPVQARAGPGAATAESAAKPPSERSLPKSRPLKIKIPSRRL